MQKTENFKSAWWLPGPHLQTLWPPLCRKNKFSLPLKRERIEFADGDFVDLDWVTVNQQGPIVILLHGLEGSIESAYAKGMLQALTQEGWRAVFMYFRGCSGEHNRLARCYHSGDTNDLAQIIQMFRAREASTPIAAIGFSLGGNVLLKWLGETAKNNFLTAAVAISVPFELKKAVTKLQKGFSRIYQRHLLRSLQKKMTNKFSVTSLPVPVKSFYQLKSLWQFDEEVTAPLHGFKGADDYYHRSSCRQFLKTIEVPTLILHAEDDPFMTPSTIPQTNELSESVTLELTKTGGHIGFVSGKLPWRPEYWLEKRVPHFLGDYLQGASQVQSIEPSSSQNVALERIF